MSDSALSDPTALAIGPSQFEALTKDAEPQFHAVSARHGRAGIRIERVFWESLSLIGTGLGLKRSQVVAQVTDLAKAADVSVSSALRCYVAATQRDQLARLENMLSIEEVAKLQQLAPVPSFALTRQKRLLVANGEFVAFLRGISGDFQKAVSPEIAQLSLDRPIEQVFDDLAESGASTRCSLTIRLNDRQKRVLCKFVAVPPQPTQAVVGYVLV